MTGGKAQYALFDSHGPIPFHNGYESVRIAQREAQRVGRDHPNETPDSVYVVRNPRDLSTDRARDDDLRTDGGRRIDPGRTPRTGELDVIVHESAHAASGGVETDDGVCKVCGREIADTRHDGQRERCVPCGHPAPDPTVATDGGRDLVEACPECDTGGAYHRVKTDDFGCKTCGAVFDEPVVRTSYGGRISEHGRDLIAADPDVVTDGGVDVASSEPIEIERPENAEIGAAVECFVAERWPALDRIAGPDSPEWFDAVANEPITTVDDARVADLTVVDDGTHVDAKACSLTISHGASARHGRWWFRRSNHEQLVDAGGEYALTVYRRLDDVEISIVRCALVPARTVDVLLTDRWTSCGDRHRADESAQLPAPAIFDDLDAIRSAYGGGRDFAEGEVNGSGGGGQ